MPIFLQLKQTLIGEQIQDRLVNGDLKKEMLLVWHGWEFLMMQLMVVQH